MSRLARPFLLASLIAYHAAVSLCGPCLHELAGASHEMGAARRPHHAESPTGSRGESADLCLICQFVAQGQLPAELRIEPPAQLIAELAIPIRPIPEAIRVPLLLVPRAPPVAARTSW